MKKQLRRVLVLLLAFTMCFGSAVTLFAADAEVTCPGADKVHTKANCEYVAEEVVAPLCGKNGYTIYACTACHTHFVDDVTPALGGCSEFKVVAEVPATCAKAGVKAHKECVVCGAKYIGDEPYTDEQLELPMIDHTWGEWEGEVATCEGKSTRVRKCTVCGKEDKENKAAIGHKYVIKEITVAPDKTMAVPGKAIAICENCKAEHEVEVWAEHECDAKDAKGKYLYLTLVKAKAATCTEEGIVADYYVCKCGKILNANLVEMTAKEIAENVIEKHPDRTEQVVEPTCTVYGFKTTVCTKCGEKISDVEVIKPTGHKYLTYPADVTRTVEGETVVIHKKGEVVEDYSIASEDTEQTTITKYCLNDKCSECVNKDEKARAHETADKVWSKGETEIFTDADGIDVDVVFDEDVKAHILTTVVKAAGHTYVKGTTPADCGHGVLTFWYCTNEDCSLALAGTTTVDGKEYKTLVNGKNVHLVLGDKAHPITVAKTKDGKEAVNANNHVVETPDITKSKDPTCTENGYNVGTCYCGKEVQETVPALGHELGDLYFSQWRNQRMCSTERVVTLKCKNCNYQLQEKIPAIASSDKLNMTSKEFFKSVYTIKLSNGQIVKLSEKAIHNFGQGSILRAGSCAHSQLTQYTCADCGKVYTVDYEWIDNHTKPHGFGEDGYVYKISADGKLVERPASAEKWVDKDGKEVAKGTKGAKLVLAQNAAYFCKVCGEFVDGGTVKAFGGHTVTTEVNEKGFAPTCETTGLKDNYYKCDVCDAYILKDGTSAVIKATGHDYVKVAGKKATCTEDGVKEHYTCANKGCNKVFTYDAKTKKYVEYTGELVIAATGHKAVLWDASENDCTKTAYKYNYCSACKAEWVEGYAAPKGHTMADVKVVNPTCTTDGVSAHKKCKNCDYTEGKTIIPATGHRDKDGTFTDCNRKGRTCTAEKCPDYYDAKTKTYIKVADRKAFTDNKHAPETKDVHPTCTAAGYTITVCTKCNEVLKVENPVAALGHKMQDKDTWTVVVAPTEVSAGKATSKCMNPNCDYEEEVVIPKLSDLKLNITADNAVVAGETIVESGKVKVTVSISSLDSDIWGTNFTVKYDAKMFSFDSAKVITENFLVNANALTKVVNKATVQTGDVKVLATAKNDEAGNPQNVKLAGTETLVELYFTVVGNAAKQQTFEIVEPSAGDLDGNKEIKASGVATVDVAQIADVDGIAGINVNDLSALLRLMRNEEYSAAADLDKDGEITALDFTLLVNYLSGFATMKDIRNATAE